MDSVAPKETDAFKWNSAQGNLAHSEFLLI
jgi:hypothetical protein